MLFKFKLILILALTCSEVMLLSQDQVLDIIENTVQNTETEFENENIIEDLQNLAYHPININDTLVDYSSLVQYSLLTPLQVNHIKNYIKQFGSFLTINELIAVPGLSALDVRKIKPYVSIKKEKIKIPGLMKQFQWSRKTLLLRSQYLLEKQNGFKKDSLGEKNYLGTRPKLYFKYRQQFQNKMSFGFQADKDSGEELFTGSNQRGFDFYSAHFSFQPKSGLINQIIIGDYEVKVGQGLIQWNGFSLGKGTNATSIFMKSNILRPYTSSNEYNFLRGASSQFQLNKHFSATVWASSKKVDGNRIFVDTLGENTHLTSIQTSGLHRTISEIRHKKSTSELLIGSNIEFQNDWLKFGLTAQHSSFSNSIIYDQQQYQKFYPDGNSFQNLGVNYSAIRKNFYFFGETAVNQESALAAIHGLQHFIGTGVKATIAYRNYAKDYRNFYSSALGENTSTNNEEGVYLGLEYAPLEHLKFETYADYFRFPWKKFRVSKPSRGNELFFRSIYQPRSSIELELRTRLEHKEIDLTGSLLPAKQLTDQKRYNNRIELRYRPNDRWYFKSRIGHSYYETSKKEEHGFLLFQDTVYEFANKKIKLYGRSAIFHSPTFDSRVYAYENDLLYNFSVPAYYGQGVRYYSMASFEPITQLKLWLKVSQTIFSDRQTISSGNNTIDGNKRTDVKMQLQWRF